MKRLREWHESNKEYYAYLYNIYPFIRYSLTFTRIILFFIIFVLLFLGVTYFFTPMYYEDSYLAYKAEEENSIDVVFVGNSYTYCAYNPMVLWGEEGITSYVLATPIRSMVDSLYWIDVAAMTQKPKAVVLELHLSWREPPNDLGNLAWAIGSMPLSIPRVMTSLRFTPEKYWPYMIFDLFNFHGEWKNGLGSIENVTRRLKPDYDDAFLGGYKGFVYLTEYSESVRTEYTQEISDEQYDMILSIIKEANEKCEKIGARLVMAAIPNATTVLNELIKLLGRDLSDEENISIVNMNTDEMVYDVIGVDFKKDFMDGGHMTYVGANKVSRYMGNYLSETLGIEDKRDKPGEINDTWRMFYEGYKKELRTIKFTKLE